MGVRIVRVPFLIPPQAAAQAWGGIILVRSRYWPPGERLIAHELYHCHDWQRFGAAGFIARYIAGLIKWRGRGGFAGLYKHHPMEVEAARLESSPEYLALARELLREQGIGGNA